MRADRFCQANFSVPPASPVSIMKYALVIPDGCADEPQASLGGKTPLQAARTPHMDEIARLVPGYGGITYARLERNGVNAPTMSYSDAGTPILEPGSILKPQLVSTNGSR